MATAGDGILDLERQRLRLEENIAQLRKALQHWQTWDAEYEALKEEVDAALQGPDDEAQELLRIRSEYDGDLVSGKELDDVFGPPGSRSAQQIVNLLQRRIDYVTKNIENLQKQLDAAESQLSPGQLHGTDEPGDPCTEIVENLDQDDNVVSYHLGRPGDSLSQVQAALAKAGVEDLGPEQPIKPHSTDSALGTQTRPASADKATRPAEPPKESVPSVEETNTGAPARPPEMSRQAKRIERIMKTAKEQESISQQKPTIPADEDPADAALRQQMLKYSMGEVGAVVAELQLEEDGTDDGDDFDYGHDDESEDDDDDDDDDDGEDWFRRSASRVVTGDYRQRMLELEKKLGVKSRFTQDEETDSDGGDEGIGRIVVRHAGQEPSSASKPPPAKSIIKGAQSDVDVKKGVRFARALDVAPDQAPAAASARETEEPLVEPVGDVIERAGPASAPEPLTEPKAPRKTSRFAKARLEAASSGDVPKGPLDVPRRFADPVDRAEPASGPEGATLADQLVEREPRPNPRPPGELDDALDLDALAGEHQALRKRFIQRQGGFLREDESPVQVLDESENAAEPVSRFKAARLSRQ